jgi:hypothetical protein
MSVESKCTAVRHNDWGSGRDAHALSVQRDVVSTPEEPTVARAPDNRDVERTTEPPPERRDGFR